MTEDNIAEIIKTLKPLIKSRAESTKSVIGLKFGKLTVTDVPGRSIKRKCIMVKCMCDCGALTIAALSDVQRLHTTSCGCLASQRRNVHGDAGSIGRKAKGEYASWSRMKCHINKVRRDECLSGCFIDYDDIVCPRWIEKGKGYINFLEDMGRKPTKSQLRKRDDSKRYDKDNCYWRGGK